MSGHRTGSPAFDAWCADPRPLTFAEFLDEEYGDDTSTAIGLPAVYEACGRMITAGRRYAVCFVEVKNFKAHRDRYGRDRAAKVTALVGRVLREAVEGIVDEDGTIARVAGNDFIAVIPAEEIPSVCSAACTRFDEDMRLRVGGGRGPIPAVPTLAIAVETNEEYDFTHFSQIRELAGEMMAYAKATPGSVFVVDRRRPPQ